MIKKINNFYRYEVVTSRKSQKITQNALTHMTMTYPGFMDEDNRENLDILWKSTLFQRGNGELSQNIRLCHHQPQFLLEQVDIVF